MVVQLTRITPILFILAVSLIACSTKAQKYTVDKASPNDLYQVKLEIWEEEGKGTRDYTERLKVQYFKGQEIIHSYEAENADQYEPSMREGKQVIEWVGDNLLRMGSDRSDQPYFDDIVVINNTGEFIKYLSVGYGKFESFEVFDLAPGSSVHLAASPGFMPNGTSNYFLGYGGETQSGRKFEGTLEKKQRTSPHDGAINFQILIGAKDSHWY